MKFNPCKKCVYQPEPPDMKRIVQVNPAAFTFSIKCRCGTLITGKTDREAVALWNEYNPPSAESEDTTPER
jgi:hypothetical protein